MVRDAQQFIENIVLAGKSELASFIAGVAQTVDDCPNSGQRVEPLCAAALLRVQQDLARNCWQIPGE
ncbi:hypothetical protein D9M69_642250 [compost metagenome]